MSLTFELDHIGVAVNNLDTAGDFYQMLGLGAMTKEHVPGEKVTVGFFETANHARIELLEPSDPSSTIAKYLGKRGPGIHHICLRVNDIRLALDQLKSKGVRLINETPIAGAHECLVAFIHPQSTGGVLIELSQSQHLEGPK